MQRRPGPLGVTGLDETTPEHFGRGHRVPGPQLDQHGAGPRARVRRSVGWLKFDGFQLIWFAHAYPNTDRIVYETQAQSGKTKLIERDNEVVAGFRSPFSESRNRDTGPIPPGAYDVLISDAGVPKLLPGYGRDRDEHGRVTAVYQFMKPAFGIQRIPDDLLQALDNPRTPEDESFTMVDVWGRYRARIEARPGTNTFGRGGFYLHSSKKIHGTHGCIETLGDEEIFHRLAHARELYGVRRIPLAVKSAPAWMFTDEAQSLMESGF